MPQHTPILIQETFLSPPVLLHSKSQKRRLPHVLRWSGIAMFLGWLVLFVG
jgi:hypothetical protein